MPRQTMMPGIRNTGQRRLPSTVTQSDTGPVTDYVRPENTAAISPMSSNPTAKYYQTMQDFAQNRTGQPPMAMGQRSTPADVAQGVRSTPAPGYQNLRNYSNLGNNKNSLLNRLTSAAIMQPYLKAMAQRMPQMNRQGAPQGAQQQPTQQTVTDALAQMFQNMNQQPTQAQANQDMANALAERRALQSPQGVQRRRMPPAY